MAIKGSLSEASLTDVLQLLALGQKTGCLSLAREGSLGAIHFDRGRIVHATLVNRYDRLGDHLVRDGAITPDALARVVASVAPVDDRDLADALLENNLVEREQVEAAYREQVEEAVFHLFSWSQGTFTFEAESRPSMREHLVSINADSLLLEGARRVDEWTLIAKKIPSLDLIFEVDQNRIAQREVGLSNEQQRIAGFLDGTNDVSAIVLRSGLNEFEVGKAIFGLLTAGFAQRVGRSVGNRQPSPESRVAEHRNLGVAFYRTAMYDESQREFRRVLELRDGDASARFYLGLVQLRKHEWREAVATFTAASQFPDAKAQIFHNLAFAFEQLGDYVGAEEALAEATRRSSVRDPRTCLAQAVVAIKCDKLGYADQQLSAARALWGPRQPSAAWFHFAGLAAALGGDLARAIALLEEGVGIHPQAVALQNNLAVAHERRGTYDTAARALEHALLQDANVPQLHKNLGDYHYRMQRYDEAHEDFTRVVRLAPQHGSDVHLKLGNIHFRRGAVDEARDSWTQSLALDPDNRIVQANLGAVSAKTVVERVEDTASVGAA
ncbi:MAG: tetratricopeptide repeat protein [Gemmatimonadota bacterium]|nr:tetratricopeptide repeat protein [Gemmatimonadota bacterium]